MINILIVSISFYLFVLSVQGLKTVFADIHFSDLFKKKDEEVGVEIPSVETVKPRYDVEAFRRRIEQMKDEDGLYDIPEPAKPVTDFTGTEVITENFELEMDKFIGSK